MLLESGFKHFKGNKMDAERVKSVNSTVVGQITTTGRREIIIIIIIMWLVQWTLPFPRATSVAYYTDLHAC